MASARSPIDADVARPSDNGRLCLAVRYYQHRRRGLPGWPPRSRRSLAQKATRRWSHDPRSTSGAMELCNSRSQVFRRR